MRISDKLYNFLTFGFSDLQEITPEKKIHTKV